MDWYACVAGVTEDRPANGVFRSRFCGGGSLKYLARRDASGRIDRLHAHITKCDGAGLVQDDGVDGPQRLEVNAPFDDRPKTRRPANRAKNREWRTRRHAAGARDNDDRNGRLHVPRHRERHHGRGPSAEDEVTRESISDLLDRRTILRGMFDGFDDSAEGGVAPNPPHLNLQSA